MRGLLEYPDDGASSIGGLVIGGTTGSVLFINPSNTLAQDNANFFWDPTNKKLGIGNTAPSGMIDITKSSANSAAAAFIFKGYANDGSFDTSNGVGLYLTHNDTGNRQFSIVDTASFKGVRFLGNNIDAISTLGGTRANMNIGNDTTNVSIGSPYGSGPTTSKVFVWGNSGVKLQEWADSSGTVLNAMLYNGNLGLGVTNPGSTLTITKDSVTSGSLQTISQTRNNTNGNVATGLMNLTATRTAGTSGNGGNILNLSYTGEAVGTGRALNITQSGGNDNAVYIDMSANNAQAALYIKRTNSLNDAMTFEISNADLSTISAAAVRIYRTGGTIANSTRASLIGGAMQTNNGSVRTMSDIVTVMENNVDATGSGGLLFRTAKNLTLTDRMYITSDGYTGIGTTSPLTRLQIGKLTANGSTNVITIGHNGTTAISNDGTATIKFASQFGNYPFTMGAEGNGYNFYIRQTNGGQGTFRWDFGTISSTLYQYEYTYITDHYEQIFTGKWLSSFTGSGVGGSYYGFKNTITPGSTSVLYDTFRIERGQANGYYPQSNDPILSLFAGDSTATVTATNRYVARFNRLGFLGIGTTNTYAAPTTMIQAALTVDQGSRTGVKFQDGTTAEQVKTVGTSTSVVCVGGVNGENAMGLIVGSQITANGLTRTITAITSAQGFTVDTAVDWANGGAGYNFTYKNPYISLQDGATKYFQVDPIGNTKVGARLQKSKGSDVAAANDLTLGNDGNLFKVTGNTQVNAIITTNWQAGSEVTLLFTGTPTVKHNTAGGAGTAVLFLAGSLDLIAANNTILGLIYDGTQWQETFRKVA